MSHETERVVELRLTPHELFTLRDAVHTALQRDAGGDDKLPAATRARVYRTVLDQLEVARRPEAVA